MRIEWLSTIRQGDRIDSCPDPSQNAKAGYSGIVAQLEERLLHTQEVIGSRPVGPIIEIDVLIAQ